MSVDVRDLTDQEMNFVFGGKVDDDSPKEHSEDGAGVQSVQVSASALLGAGAAMAGTLALVPGPQQIAIAAVAATLGLASVGAALMGY